MSNSFTYNGLGLRVSKTDSTGTKNFVCDGTEVASAVLSDGAATYTPGLSERRGGASKFTHADALGSTRGLTDSSQSATDSLRFDAFGMTTGRTGTTPTPFGFAGGSQYQTDADTGLMLLGHRYYDASVGRFLSADPARAGSNWYAYCYNNPLVSTDPRGEISRTELGLFLLLMDLIGFKPPVIKSTPSSPTYPGPTISNPPGPPAQPSPAPGSPEGGIESGGVKPSGGGPANSGMGPEPPGPEPPGPGPKPPLRPSGGLGGILARLGIIVAGIEAVHEIITYEPGKPTGPFTWLGEQIAKPFFNPEE